MRIFVRKKIILFVSILFVFLLFCCRDIITGYWKLNTLCELEAGSHVYEPLERNVGWIMPGFYEASDKYPTFLPNKYKPSFIRYIKNNGDEFDMLTFDHRDNYKIIHADKTKAVRYIINSTGQYPGGDRRFWKNSEIIIDIKKRIIVASYTTFSFRWFTNRWFIFPPPRPTYCTNASSPLDNDEFYREVYENNITYRRIFK